LKGIGEVDTVRRRTKGFKALKGNGEVDTLRRRTNGD
jgi:hypothetical protein